MKLMVSDTETSGLPDWKQPSEAPQQPHICELAAIKYDEAGNELERFHSFVRPDGWSIAIEAQKAHGYSTEYLMDVGRNENEVVFEYMDFQSDADIRVGHNESFDARIMRIAIKRFGMFGMGLDVDYERQQNDSMAAAYRARTAMCTMRLATPIVKIPPTPAMGKRFPYKNPTLAEAYLHFFGEEMQGAHGAVADTENCAKVFFHMLNKGFISLPVM